MMRLSLYLLALALCVCSACAQTPSGATADGGADALAALPPPRRQLDASVVGDAAVVGDDASYVFDGQVVDGMVNPFHLGTWNSVPGLACGIWLAADPNVSVPPFTWTACASGRSGCKRFDANWPSPSQHKMGFDRWETVRLVNGQPIMRDARIYSSNPYAAQADMFVVETLSGNRLFAMGQFYDVNTSCMGVETIGDRGITLALAHGILPNVGYFMAWSPWSAPNALSFKGHALADFGLDPVKGGMSQGATGSGSMFLELKNPDSIGIYDPDHDTFTPTSPRMIGEGAMAVTDGALAFGFNATYGVNLVHPDGSWNEVVVPTAPPPRRVSAFGVDRSSGQQLAWVEADYGFSWSNSVLWTSPYATSRTALQPRKVAVLADPLGTGGLSMVVHAGVALTLVDRDRALATRLADGMGWTITAEPGDSFSTPLWVDDQEVWIAIGDATDSNWQASFRGIVRFTRASLGPPNVASGL